MNPKFLVVDDEREILQLMEAMLGAMGCDTQIVDNGSEALKLLSTQEGAKSYDAVFLDIMMPGMNGYEVLQVIKNNPLTSEMPVIMLTAKDKSDEIIAGYQHGADYYITKPFTKEQLTFGLDIVFGNQTEEGETEEAPKKEKKTFFLPEAG